MKIIIKIIKYIMIVLLSICILGIIMLKLLSSTILSESYMLKQFEESNYYESIEQLVDSNFEKYIAQSGLDENVIKEIVTKEQIRKDTETIIGNIYRGTQNDISIEEVKTNLDTNIKNSLGDRKLTEAEETSIEQFENTICNEYKRTVLSTQYEEKIHTVLNAVNKLYDTVKIGLYSFAVFVAILIVLLNIGNIVRALPNLGVSFSVAGIFYLIINAGINNRIKIENIKILNDSISQVLKNTMTQILDQLVSTSVACIVIGVVLILLGNIVNAYKNKIEGN